MRLIALAVMFTCACGAAAAPQRRVAVLGVERHSGAQDKAFEVWLSRHVDTHFEVVASAPPEDGIDSEDAGAIRAVAEKLGVDAVVYGELSKKKRGKMRLTVRVHDGHTGQLIETHEVAIKGGKAVVKQEKRFARELLAMLPPPTKATKVAKAKPAKAKKKKAIEEPAEEPAEDDEPTIAASKPSRKPLKSDDATEETVDFADDAADDERAAKRDEDERAAFVPATNLKNAKLDRAGQAGDEEMPTLFVKK
jgi:hypothetical protein